MASPIIQSKSASIADTVVVSGNDVEFVSPAELLAVVDLNFLRVFAVGVAGGLLDVDGCPVGGRILNLPCFLLFPSGMVKGRIAPASSPDAVRQPQSGPASIVRAALRLFNCPLSSNDGVA